MLVGHMHEMHERASSVTAHSHPPHTHLDRSPDTLIESGPGALRQRTPEGTLRFLRRTDITRLGVCNNGSPATPPCGASRGD